MNFTFQLTNSKRTFTFLLQEYGKSVSRYYPNMSPIMTQFYIGVSGGNERAEFIWMPTSFCTKRYRLLLASSAGPVLIYINGKHFTDYTAVSNQLYIFDPSLSLEDFVEIIIQSKVDHPAIIATIEYRDPSQESMFKYSTDDSVFLCNYNQRVQIVSNNVSNPSLGLSQISIVDTPAKWIWCSDGNSSSNFYIQI